MSEGNELNAPQVPKDEELNALTIELIAVDRDYTNHAAEAIASLRDVITALRQELEIKSRSAEYWERDCADMTSNRDYWQSRAERAEANEAEFQRRAKALGFDWPTADFFVFMESMRKALIRAEAERDQLQKQCDALHTDLSNSRTLHASEIDALRKDAEHLRALIRNGNLRADSE